jgi:hypothetical protein
MSSTTKTYQSMFMTNRQRFDIVRCSELREHNRVLFFCRTRKAGLHPIPLCYLLQLHRSSYSAPCCTPSIPFLLCSLYISTSSQPLRSSHILAKNFRQATLTPLSREHSPEIRTMDRFIPAGQPTHRTGNATAPISAISARRSGSRPRQVRVTSSWSLPASPAGELAAAPPFPTDPHAHPPLPTPRRRKDRKYTPRLVRSCRLRKNMEKQGKALSLLLSAWNRRRPPLGSSLFRAQELGRGGAD